ncbi:16S rRNA (uracil(1498)-N(3))-methyltransferase [Enterococcus faecalis]|nr:16S rRNA (uracil(1498)-N(3))-methyltransferase [Enterococcus faecalis]
MQRYFMKEDYQEKDLYKVADENYHHIVRVMRMTPNDRCYLVFQNKTAILAEIVEIDSTSVYFKEISKEEMDKELPIEVTIACGLPKGDKLEWIVQKGTELGGNQFIGFPAKTSVVKWDHKKRAAKEKRLQKIATEAAEQSHRQQTPSVSLVEKTQEIIAQFDSYNTVLVAYEESAKQGEKSQLAQVLSTCQPGARLCVLFGPEGGFAPQEIEQFLQAGAKLCGLGPRILRAETAPLYLLSAVSYQMELLN